MQSEQQWLNIFSGNLLSLLNDARMTQNELSEATGISKGTISKYINAMQMPTIISILKIAEALDCSVDDLTVFD